MERKHVLLGFLFLGVLLTPLVVQATVTLPDPSTYEVRDIRETHARFSGGVVDDGGEACDFRFVYWKEGGEYQYTPWDTDGLNDHENNSCGALVNDLAYGSIYYTSLELRNSAGSMVYLRRYWARSFKTPARVIITSGEVGSVVAPGEGEFIYDYGVLVPIRAEAGPFWEFTGWSGTAVDMGYIKDPVAISTTYRAIGDTTLKANFLALIMVSSSAGGEVVAPGEGLIKEVEGTSIALEAKPNPFNEFAGWSGPAVDAGLVADPNAASTTLIVSGGKDVMANFVGVFNVSSSRGGSVVEPGEGTIKKTEGTVIPLVAQADPLVAFTGWTGSAVDAGLVADPNAASTTLTVMGGKDVKAHFVDALAHHWKLDEDTAWGDTIVLDAIGGVDGNNIGALTDIGISGNALRFDGSETSHVDVNGIMTDSLKDITVTLWINPDVNSLATPKIKRVFSGGDNFEVILQGDTGQVANNFYQKGATYPISTLPLVEGEWTHVGMTSSLLPDGSGDMSIYINGMLDVVMEATADDDWNAGLMKMGHRPGRPDDERYRGALDDIRIYKGVLSEAEIAATMTDFPMLVHHWKLDEDSAIGETVVVDSVGGVDGNNVGALTDVGVFGNALRFDGMPTSHVDVNGIATDDLKKLTVSLWLNPDANSLATSKIKRVFSGGDHFEVVLQGSTGQIANNFYRRGGTYPIGSPMPGGEWTHVAVTSELLPPGSGRMAIYVNGLLDVAMDALADDDWNDGLMKMGHRPGRPDSERYIGALDDIRIYQGVLSGGQIRTMATVPAQSGRWKLDEGQGDLAVDISGYNNNGVLLREDGGWIEDAERETVLYFAGDVNGLYVEAGEIPHMTLVNDFTWAFWANQDPALEGKNQIVVGNRYDVNGVDFDPRQFIKFTPTKFEWHMNRNGDDNMDYEDMVAGEWTHHAVVKDANELTYYRNGVKGAEGVITQALSGPMPLNFGGDISGRAGENWMGMLSDVRIFETALDPEDISLVLLGK